jgi:hypothetical protein
VIWLVLAGKKIIQRFLFFVAMIDCCSEIPYKDLVEAIECLKRNDPTLTELK